MDTEQERTDDLFYRPDISLCSDRKPIINEDDIEKLIGNWHFQDKAKLHRVDGRTCGSLLDNNLPWQKKWYLRFDPPKSAEELQIAHYWRYQGPKLEDFIVKGDKAANSPQSHQMVQNSLSSLKSMATLVLSGTTQNSLASESYLRNAGGGSAANDNDEAASMLSAQLKMPTNETGQKKRSILASLKTELNKKDDETPKKYGKKRP